MSVARKRFTRHLRDAVETTPISLGQVARRTNSSVQEITEVLEGNRVPNRDNLIQLLDACEVGDIRKQFVLDSWDVFLRAVAKEGRREDRSASVRAVVGTSLGGLHRLREDVASFDLKPDPLTANTKEEFLACMQDFHVWAGELSYRQIVINAGKTVGASTLCEALKGKQMPSLKVVIAFIKGCGGSEDDLVQWTTAWRRIRMTRTASSNITQLRATDQRRIG
ncbi:hypothetical protein ACFXJ8_39140 [Nonomuraea sp. NPDC059194]|uniref:hypothetical protein n=1 Tax=Nonomuraea sp. NPDC059194 TaxID=3346764 RepID=UPI0036BF7E77